MSKEIKMIMAVLTLGLSLVAYAHSTFATKDITSLILQKLQTMDDRLYSIQQLLHEGD